MTHALTPLAAAYLRERRAEALEIVTHGGDYTHSQRSLAWAFLAQHRPPQPPAGAKAWALNDDGAFDFGPEDAA